MMLVTEPVYNAHSERDEYRVVFKKGNSSFWGPLASGRYEAVFAFRRVLDDIGRDALRLLPTPEELQREREEG